VTQLLNGLRLGVRLLWRTPGFTAVALVTLAVGIAANTAIFSIVHGTLLAPLPYPDADQLVMIWSGVCWRSS
jgi:putative ABC transport system permease protein